MAVLKKFISKNYKFRQSLGWGKKMIALIDDETFKVLELTTSEGKLVKIGDIFGLTKGNFADESGESLRAGTKIRIKEILVPPASTWRCVIIKGILPDESLFSGALSSIDLDSRIYISGKHGDVCGGNVLRKGGREWCEKCGTCFCKR